ncbi:MAG: hypothetical protein ABH878_06070, partial [bacterium]
TIPMGFVPTTLFARGIPAAVEQAVQFCLAEMPKPAVLCSGCDLPAQARPELVRIMTREFV